MPNLKTQINNKKYKKELILKSDVVQTLDKLGNGLQSTVFTIKGNKGCCVKVFDQLKDDEHIIMAEKEMKISNIL